MLFLLFGSIIPGFDIPGFDLAEPLPSRIYNLPIDGSFSNAESIRSNTTVNVLEGATVGNNFSAGAPGKLSSNIMVNISGGAVGDFLSAYSGSFINISGGTIGRFFMVRKGSEVNVSGGSVGDRFCALHGSVINICGGRFQNRFLALAGSEVTISGGSFDGDFDAQSGSHVTLFGSSFELDGVSIDDLSPGVPYTITERDVTLTCRLADGSSFRYDLAAGSEMGDHCSPDAKLSIAPIEDIGSRSTNMTYLLVGLGITLLGMLIGRNVMVIRRNSSPASSQYKK
jgi:hypothetical protein